MASSSPSRSRLFSPIKLRDLVIKNRIWVSPMCQYSCVNQDGVVNDWHFVHLASRAVGGVGLIMAEASAITPDGRISPFDAGIWSKEQVQAWSKITSFIKTGGGIPGDSLTSNKTSYCVPAIQLAHAGRKASTSPPWISGGAVIPPPGVDTTTNSSSNPSHAGTGWVPRAPSAIPFYPTNTITPLEMSLQDIEEIQEAFVQGAKNALEAGFEVIELHYAHGYLIHEFLSPLTNHRTDSYGGSFENRIRMAIETATKVRHVWPAHLPLFVRISATDWMEKAAAAGEGEGGEEKERKTVAVGGWDIEQSVNLCAVLKEVAGVDLIDVSSGGAVLGAKIPAGPSYQVPFATRIRTDPAIQAGYIPTAAVGFITDPHQAEKIITEELADAVFLGRELLRDPYWTFHAAKTLGVDEEIQQSLWPSQYLRAKQ